MYITQSCVRREKVPSDPRARSSKSLVTCNGVNANVDLTTFRSQTDVQIKTFVHFSRVVRPAVSYIRQKAPCKVKARLFAVAHGLTEHWKTEFVTLSLCQRRFFAARYCSFRSAFQDTHTIYRSRYVGDEGCLCKLYAENGGSRGCIHLSRETPSSEAAEESAIHAGVCERPE
jgi:hypothetical protein